jgi:hypothetical protein
MVYKFVCVFYSHWIIWSGCWSGLLVMQCGLFWRATSSSCGMSVGHLLLMMVSAGAACFGDLMSDSCIVRAILDSLIRIWFTMFHFKNRGLGSIVSVTTDYGLDGMRIESWWGWGFLQRSRLALGPTQPPVQWVLGLSGGGGEKSGRGGTLKLHPLPVPLVKKG